MADTIKFLHISDIHMLRDYTGNIMAPVVGGGMPDPAELLREILSTPKYAGIDFVIITGDLTHEGDTKDYVYFRKIIEGRGLPVPVFVTLGNHDNICAFAEGYLSEKTAFGEYYYAAEIKGLRIIALDSNCGGGCQGEISCEQLKWLSNILHNKAPNGSILMLHHPAAISVTEDSLYYCLKNAKELCAAVKNSDILAIFSGHKHHNSVTIFGGIPQFTADSLGYGALFDKDYMYVTDRHGYNYCVIEKGELYVTHERYPDSSKVLAKASMEKLMEEYLRTKNGDRGI